MSFLVGMITVILSGQMATVSGHSNMHVSAQETLEV